MESSNFFRLGRQRYCCPPLTSAISWIREFGCSQGIPLLMAEPFILSRQVPVTQGHYSSIQDNAPSTPSSCPEASLGTSVLRPVNRTCEVAMIWISYCCRLSSFVSSILCCIFSFNGSPVGHTRFLTNPLVRSLD
jgi:hypothetical protein